jgi:hypothetical protein
MLSSLPLTRRRFLALTGGALVLAACGSKSSSGSTDSTLSHDHDEPTELTPAVMSSDLYARPEPQRFAFAMLSKEGGYASGGATSLAVALDPAVPAQFAPTTLHTDGLPENRGIYVSDVMFDKPGVWNAIARNGDQELPFVIQVEAKATAPTEGRAAPTAASPTNANTLGMDPICTRSPECPLHDKSLDTLIGKGRPVAVLFATPARCQSQYCGPVLDALLPMVDEFSDRVDIVHCDIYLNNRTEEVSPTVAAWSLPSEPWLFGIDAMGKITERLDGAMAQDEMRAVLERLAA